MSSWADSGEVWVGDLGVGDLGVEDLGVVEGRLGQGTKSNFPACSRFARRTLHFVLAARTVQAVWKILPTNSVFFFFLWQSASSFTLAPKPHLFSTQY